MTIHRVPADIDIQPAVVDAHLLDGTPVDDLEGWHADYDPVEAGRLDIRLADFFGPVLSNGGDEIEWAKRGGEGGAR